MTVTIVSQNFKVLYFSFVKRNSIPLQRKESVVAAIERCKVGLLLKLRLSHLQPSYYNHSNVALS
jgi:hypothetical protein